MKQESMSTDESWNVIHSMIHQAKQQFSDDSFNYLLWGWLVFIASLGHYILAMEGVEQPHMMWMLMPLGGVISFIYNYRNSKKERVKTYLEEYNKYVLIAFLVSLFIILLNMGKLQLSTYPMLMMIYGIWLFTSGGGLRFKPLIYGGIANWILAVLALYCTFDTQLLLLALAVLLGYIIPGHMLSAHYKKQKGK